jgi:alkylhydroperoxidase family enzyme
LDRLRSRLLDGPGHVEQSVRQAAFRGDAAGVPAEVAGLVDKIRHHAYQVTDEDIAKAKAAGWSDSQLFELTVATAAGAGLHRRDVIDRLLNDPKDTA